jgi:hypothetical protein
MAAFATAKAHLKPKGIFIFDCWYGPGVLSERPAARFKRLEDEKIGVVRFAEPVMHPNDNVVDVNYQVFIAPKDGGGTIEELRETHKMRYFFRPEIDFLSLHSGLEVLACREWMSNRRPGFDTWKAYFVIRIKNLV